MSDIVAQSLSSINISNPFICFNLTPVLSVDMAQLDQIYYALQNATHPDRFMTQAPAVKAVAAEKSAAINRAYQQLKDPIERLWAVIDAYDHKHDRSQNVNDHPQLIDAVFDLQAEKSTLTTAAEYQQFKNCLQQLIVDAEIQFTALIEQKSFDQAVDKIYWLTYLHKIEADTDDNMWKLSQI